MIYLKHVIYLDLDNEVQLKLKDVQQINRVRVQLESIYSRLIVSQSSQVANQQQIIGVIQGVGLGIALLAVVIGGVR